MNSQAFRKWKQKPSDEQRKLAYISEIICKLDSLHIQDQMTKEKFFDSYALDFFLRNMDVNSPKELDVRNFLISRLYHNHDNLKEFLSREPQLTLSIISHISHGIEPERYYSDFLSILSFSSIEVEAMKELKSAEIDILLCARMDFTLMEKFPMSRFVMKMKTKFGCFKCGRVTNKKCPKLQKWICSRKCHKKLWSKNDSESLCHTAI